MCVMKQVTFIVLDKTRWKHGRKITTHFYRFCHSPPLTRHTLPLIGFPPDDGLVRVVSGQVEGMRHGHAALWEDYFTKLVLDERKSEL